jgi:hypothetical protein
LLVSTIVIGFGYAARCGKDTACKTIIEAKAGVYDIRKYGFGDALKEEVNQAATEAGGMFALFNELATVGAPLPGLRRIKIPDWVQFDKDADMTDPLCPLGKHRTLLQWWGTEYRRAEDPFYWIKKMKERIELDHPEIALISDMRFINEYMWIKSNGGFTVKVERRGFTSVSTNSSHVSEQQLANVVFDYEIQVEDNQLEILKEDSLTVFNMIEQAVNPQFEAQYVK